MCIIWKLLSSNGLLDLQPDELSSKHNCFQGFNQLIFAIGSVKAVWQGSCPGSSHAFCSLGRSPDARATDNSSKLLDKDLPLGYQSVLIEGQDQLEIICFGSLNMFAQCLFTLHLAHTNTMSYLLSLSLNTLPSLKECSC